MDKVVVRLMFTIATACTFVMLAVAVAAQIQPPRNPRVAPAPEHSSAKAGLPHAPPDSAAPRRQSSPSGPGT